MQMTRLCFENPSLPNDRAAAEGVAGIKPSSGLLVEHRISGVWAAPLLGLPELTLINKTKLTLLSSAVPSSKEIRRGKKRSIFRRKGSVSVYNRH